MIMKMTVFLTKMGCGLIILFILSLFNWIAAAENSQGCQWAAVDQNSFAEILTMIDSRVAENYDRINTWQGKVRIVSDDVHEGESRNRLYEQILVDRPVPNKVKDHRELTREFALDANKGLLYDNYYSDGQNYSIDLDTGRNLQLKNLVQMGGNGKFILAPDYLLDCVDIKNRDGIIVRRDVIKQTRPQGKHGSNSHMSPGFDPRETMRIFGDITGESFGPLGGAFAKYLALFDKEAGHSIDGYPIITVEECNVGDVKKYRIVLLSLAKDSTGATVHIFLNLVCSSEAGFNVVSYTTADSNDRMIESKTWKYGLFSSVYLPVQKKELRFDYHTSNLNEQSTVTFVDQKVNQPIGEEVFTYKNLGLKDGDKFVDKITNKEYTYQNGNLIPESEEK
jgi:hypothetical protein